MEILSAIVTAISLGASEGLKSSANHAISDAYGALKAYLKTHYGSVDLKQIQEKPDSPGRRVVLEEDLRAAQAADDQQLLKYADALLEKIANAPHASSGFTLENARAARGIIVTNIVVSTGPVIARNLMTEAELRFDGIEVIAPGAEPLKKA